MRPWVIWIIFVITHCGGLLITRNLDFIRSDFEGIVISFDSTQRGKSMNNQTKLWFPHDLFSGALESNQNIESRLGPASVLQQGDLFLVMYYSPAATRAALDSSLHIVREAHTRAKILVSRDDSDFVGDIIYLFDFHIVWDGKRSGVVPCKTFFHDVDWCEIKLNDRGIAMDCMNKDASLTLECEWAPRMYKSVFLGDWGAIGDGLSATSGRVNNHVFDSYIFGGDNIYEIGITSPRDPKINETYLSHFQGVSVPQYVIEGNHDGFGNYLAQLLYTQYRPTGWVAPFYYFEKRVDIRGTKLCFLFIDTNQWALSGQVAFIESVIGSEFCKSADFITVAGHHPVFSAGGHGDDTTLRSSLLPLLSSYGVDLYISGHDHINSVHVDSDVCFVVSGAASKRTTSSWYTSTSHAAETLYSDMELYSYATLEFQGDRLTVSLIDSETGSVLFNHNLISKKQQRVATVNLARADDILVVGQRPWRYASIFILIVSLFLCWTGGIVLIHHRTIAQSLFS
jgi:tartrate-resistant acid phosphatase type 5